MTEFGWLNPTDWGEMWAHMWTLSEVSDRKRQLIGVAVCRRLGHLMGDARSVRMIDLCEAIADYPCAGSDDDWEDTRDAAVEAAGLIADGEQSVRRAAAWAAAGLGSDAHKVGRGLESAAKAIEHEGTATATELIGSLIREVFGNPFRPVAFDPAWRTATVEAIAAGVYADRAFDRLPVLADALEDAGCDAADLLAHLRGPGPHVRGCWAVDLVLGKA